MLAIRHHAPMSPPMTVRTISTISGLGLILLALHCYTFLAVNPFIHPAHRACVTPQKHAFVYDLNRVGGGDFKETHEDLEKIHSCLKDVRWNWHLGINGIYNEINLVCIIITYVILKRQTRAVHSVQTGSDFRVSLLFGAKRRSNVVWEMGNFKPKEILQ